MVVRIKECRALSTRILGSACYNIFPGWSCSGKILLQVVFILVLFVFSANAAFTSNYLHLSGWVVHNEKAVQNATIEIYEGDSLLQKMQTNYLGSFSVFLPFQKEFKFQFSKNDLITKSVTIDTRTPEDPDPEYYYFFRFEVELFEDNPNARREFFNDPVAIIYYDIGIEEFRFHRNNVKVHSGRALGEENSEEQVWPFDDPESFFTYLQQSIENPEQVNLIAAVPEVEKDSTVTEPVTDQQQEPSEPEKEQTREEAGEMLYAEYLPQQDTTKGKSTVQKPDTLTPPLENPQSEPVLQELTPEEPQTLEQIVVEKEPEDYFITFYDYRNNALEADLEQDVFFSVQLLATVKHIPAGFFDRMLETFPNAGILFYRDQDELDKYITGVFSSLEEALEKHRQLREIGMEGYLVAFAGNRRVSVSKALSLLR